MTRDFAKRRSPTKKKKAGYQSAVPAWVWLFTGSVLGAFVMFLIYLTGIPPQPGTLTPKLLVEKDEAGPQSAEADSTQESSKPRFDFYERLKENEITVNEEPFDQEQLQQRQNIQYVLQVASYKNHSDADSTRAKLILLNLNAWVETAQTPNLGTVYRVKVGPFTSKAKRDTARSTLFDNGYESQNQAIKIDSE